MAERNDHVTEAVEKIIDNLQTYLEFRDLVLKGDIPVKEETAIDMDRVDASIFESRFKIMNRFKGSVDKFNANKEGQ